MNSPEEHTKKGVRLKTRIFLKHLTFITKTACRGTAVVTEVRCSGARPPAQLSPSGGGNGGQPGARGCLLRWTRG